MIVFQDRAALVRREIIDYDRYGSPIYGNVNVPIKCTVSPLGSSETVGSRSQVETRYRMLTGPRAALKPKDRVVWRGVDYDVDGDVERHTLAGRDHHLEVILKRVTG